jgi:hypothetical protein
MQAEFLLLYMSHEIKENDTQTGRTMAWHGLTNVVDTVTIDNAFPSQKEGLNHWDVEIGTLRLPSGMDSPFSVLLATDNGQPIGKAFEDSYVPSTVREFWDSIEESLDGTGYIVESAGSIYNRNKIFASVKIDSGFKIGERVFNGFLNFLDSFDKSMAREASYSSVCVVCANTFAFAMADASRLLGRGEGFAARSKHTKNFLAGVETMKVAIAGFAGVQDAFKCALAGLGTIPASEDETRAFFASLICGGEKLSTRGTGIVERLTGLFRSGAGNAGQTWLDVFSAVTDYYSHESAGSNIDKGQSAVMQKQFLSSEFGQGRTQKENALRLMLDHGKRKAAIEAGKIILTSSAQ